MSNLPLLFAIRSYGYLGQALRERMPSEEGRVQVLAFPDGERYQRIETDPAGREVVLVGGTVSDADTLELFDLACTLHRSGAQRLTLVIPYFGYSTMERAAKPGEVVTAKERARLLSAVPTAPGGNRVILLDLHAEGIPHYFEGAIRPVHVYAKPLVMRLARELGGTDLVLACTDAGRAKWVASLANEMGVPASFVYKRRLDGTRTEVTAVSAAVKDRDVVIYDDMIRTGSSLLGAARAYRDAGARRLTAVATHGLFPGDALERIQASGLFSALAVTDSHPRALMVADKGVRVVSVAEVLAAALVANA
jgi:ribose-phosphate pyrophosphokinase